MRAFIFPGQGAQTVGMGLDLTKAYPCAKEVFERVDKAIGDPLSEIIWSGDQETLTLTANAQPALMATSLAALRGLEAEGVHIEDADFVAGHSLGEYSALCAAGALSLEDTARLLRLRGRAMQEAVPVGKGAMAAILGLDLATVRDIAEAASEVGVVVAANDNDPAQIVVSGEKAAVEKAAELAKEKGAKRALLLPVSAPFHSPLMQPAADKMANALADVVIKTPKVPVVTNVTAQAETDPEKIRQLLIDQVTGAVRWRESVAWMASQGVTETFEIGAGKALSGMVKRIERSLKTHAVGTPDQVMAAKDAIKG